MKVKKRGGVSSKNISSLQMITRFYSLLILYPPHPLLLSPSSVLIPLLINSLSFSFSCFPPSLFSLFSSFSFTFLSFSKFFQKRIVSPNSINSETEKKRVHKLTIIIRIAANFINTSRSTTIKKIKNGLLSIQRST